MAQPGDRQNQYLNLGSLNFINNIPGGAQLCLPDEQFTILEINHGFEQMFGYTWNEITERFHRRYLEMIVEEDRPRVQQAVKDQLKHSKVVEIEYRIRCKDGSIKWVMEKSQLTTESDGQRVFYTILIDITAMQATREALRLSLESHQIILDQTTDIIFEWDIAKDTLTYSSNWEKKFGYPPIASDISHKIVQDSHIHPDDLPAFIGIMENARSGVPYSETEFRILTHQNNYLWCRIRATDQYGEDGKPVKAVGVIVDIDKDKRTMDLLRHRAECDALTGLYNKTRTQDLIERYIQHCPPDQLCALMILDIDDFKSINDTKGHLLGDAVISELAAVLKQQTRSSDIIGRIGGDEFALFLKDVPSEAFVLKRAEDLMRFIRKSFIHEKREFSISCSMGIALFPSHGKTFRELYHRSDLALYVAKNRGKDQSALYQSDNSMPRDFGEPLYPDATRGSNGNSNRDV